MRCAILGAGAVGLGMAALTASLGHEAVLWSPSLAPGDAVVTSEGALEGSFPATAAPSVAAAVQGAETVIVALPGWAHRAVFDALAPVLIPGQTVLISSHASLGGLYLRRRAPAGVIIAAWGTTVVTGRRTAPLACRIGNLRSAVDVASIPAQDGPSALATCRALCGERFLARGNLLAVQLSNVNPQNHLAMLLCNVTRAERGEAWGNYWGITPAVARLMEALDAERLALAARFGVTVRTVREHFALSFALPELPVAEQAALLDTRGGNPNGPATLDTRYVTEDVPFGIAVTETLGRLAGVPTPLHSAGATLFCAIMGWDLRAENTLLPALGLEGMTPEALVGAVG
jgi:opine dehydrogenase